MRKRDLVSLALIGVSAGLVISGCQAAQKGTVKPQQETQPTSTMSPEMKAFYSTLSQESQKQFMGLDAQHKMMSMEMANQKCNGKNECAGMGGCATANHSCAGENSCKGEGGAPVKSPEDAVSAQYKHQMQQRSSLQNQP
ncbi:MAG: hypothetical protein ACKVOH_00300 [Chlamydiales bacterium]